MKIICVMAIYKRVGITRQTIEMLKKQTHPLHKIVVVGSDKLDDQLAQEAGIDYIFHNNQPLSDKWQAGIDYARQFEPDAILINGSDSWLSLNWCEVSKPFIEEGAHLVGKTEWYACKVNPNEKLRVVHRAYTYRKDPVGAGRLFSSEILDKLGWKLFLPGLNKVLDGTSYNNMLKKTSVDKVRLINSVEDAVVLDIKSTTWKTINPFNIRANHRDITGRGDISPPDSWLNNNFPMAVEVFKKLVPSLIV